MELKDFLKLAEQQGKVLIMGEDGNPKGMFLSFDEYQRLNGGVAVKPAQPQEDVAEQANREILRAQLEEVISTNDGGSGNPSAMKITEEEVLDEAVDLNPPERIDSVLSKRAQELFKSIPYESPHKDFKTPEVATNSDEEIKPNFDDI